MQSLEPAEEQAGAQSLCISVIVQRTGIGAQAKTNRTFQTDSQQRYCLKAFWKKYRQFLEL